MEITGKVKKVETQSGTSQRGPWSKTIVVIEYLSGRYPKQLALENMTKADEFADCVEGSEYTFWFDAETREYQGRYYTQCNCFNWQAVGQQPAAPQGYTPAPQQNYPPQPAPAYPQPQQGYAPQAPGYAPQPGGVVDGDCPY